jgi:DNA-binding MarR family transcriptional regulator
VIRHRFRTARLAGGGAGVEVDTPLEGYTIASMASPRRPARPAPLAVELGGTLELLRAIWELNHALESASRMMKRRLGVTGPERLFIRVVGSQPGITPRELAWILRVHPSSVTVLLKRLERRQLVARSANAADARSFHLYLTPDGERADAVRAGTIEAVVREAVEASPHRDVAVAARLLGAVAERLTSKMGRAAPRASRRSRP